jgi:hypothetical protein
LARHQVPPLSAIDPITGEAVRSSRRSPHRYQHPTPGVPTPHAGGNGPCRRQDARRHPLRRGWRLHDRAAAVSVANRYKKFKIGYDYVHTAIDDYTRLADSEVLPDKKDPTCAGFLHRAMVWFAAHGVRVCRLVTDNALVYRRGTDWGWVCSAWQLKVGLPLDQQQPAYTRS